MPKKIGKPAELSMFTLILRQVRNIPHGKVATYGDVAYAAGFPGAARQVAWALHTSHGVPWQRVVGAGGKILLPGEQGFEQRMRLQGEGVQFHGMRIAMESHQHSFFKKKNPAKQLKPKKPAKPQKPSAVFPKHGTTRKPRI